MAEHKGTLLCKLNAGQIQEINRLRIRDVYFVVYFKKKYE